jgi:hypothetical protein
VGDDCNDADDIDGDEFADWLDTCPDLFNPTQPDLDDDFIGDECDPDQDGDGVCDNEDDRDLPNPGCTGVDNCPLVDNTAQSDSDGDGFGDACDFEIFVPSVDEVEPNDEAPQFLGFALVNRSMVVTGSAGAGDAGDMYRLVAPVSGTLAVSLHLPPGVDYDVYVNDSYTGAQFNNPERSAIEVQEGEVVDIVVNYFQQIADYQLEVKLDVDQENVLDPFAPYDIGQLQRTDFEPDYDMTEFYSGRVGEVTLGDPLDWDGDLDLENGELDVYAFTAAADGPLTVTLTFDPGNDLDFVLWSDVPDPAFQGFIDGGLPARSRRKVSDSTGAYTLSLNID